MLSLLNIENVALIDRLSVKFGQGLNLLTGETGSGKSIIVDSLGALIGARVSSDIVKQNADTARIEGVFLMPPDAELSQLLIENGFETDGDEIIIRREISAAGRNRVYVNGRITTAAVLRHIGVYLAEIHGQGEHTLLYDVENHLALLDDFAKCEKEIATVASCYERLAIIRRQLSDLRQDESEKLQLIDVLKFQIAEIAALDLSPGEDEELENEKRRLNNIEKLSSLSTEAYDLLYDNEHATLTTLDRATRVIGELAEYDQRFRSYDDQLAAARAVIAELGSEARDFAASIEFSPSRLDEIENRLSEIARLTRKYGGTIESVLEHHAAAAARLASIEFADERQAELEQELSNAEAEFRTAATRLSEKRKSAAKKFSAAVEQELHSVALDKAVFDVRFTEATEITPRGIDHVEFYFSANPGEPPRPLVRVASGGEASRLTLILRSVAGGVDTQKTAVYDEIDVGIGGRVAEAVGRRLKSLSGEQQVLCVTHQPQIASLADRHLVVEKSQSKDRTTIDIRELTEIERVEEIARMLAGEQITDAARENARAMLAGAR